MRLLGTSRDSEITPESERAEQEARTRRLLAQVQLIDQEEAAALHRQAHFNRRPLRDNR